MNKQSERQKIKKKEETERELTQAASCFCNNAQSVKSVSLCVIMGGKREDTKDYRERELSSKVS